MKKNLTGGVCMGSFGNLNINGMKQVRCGKAENNAVKGKFNNVHKKYYLL